MEHLSIAELLDALPPELLSRVWATLIPRDLARVGSICRHWNALEIQHRQMLWRGLVLQRWPVRGKSPAFTAMGVCWRTRFQLLRAEEPMPEEPEVPEIDEEPDYRVLLARLNTQYKFFLTLTLGGVTAVSKACLGFDRECLMKVRSPPSNSQLSDMGTQIYANGFSEADAATLDFVTHGAPAIECYVQRTDGKVATLFYLAAAEQPYLDNSRLTPYVRDADAPPNSDHPEGGWRRTKEFMNGEDAFATPKWVSETATRTFDDFEALRGHHDVLYVESMWYPERNSQAVFVAGLERGLQDEVPDFDDYNRRPIAVHEMDSVLRQHLEWA